MGTMGACSVKIAECHRRRFSPSSDDGTFEDCAKRSFGLGHGRPSFERASDHQRTPPNGKDAGRRARDGGWLNFQ